MSDLIEVIRLLRQLWAAERQHDASQGRRGVNADSEWCRTHEALLDARRELDAFVERRS